MNELQKKLLNIYLNKEYAWLTNPEQRKEAGIELDNIGDYLKENAGDTLLIHLFSELETDGDTTNEEYIRRLERSIMDIRDIIKAI